MVMTVKPAANKLYEMEEEATRVGSVLLLAGGVSLVLRTQSKESLEVQ